MRAAQTQQNKEILFEQAVTEHSRRLLTVARAIGRESLCARRPRAAGVDEFV